MRKTGEKHGGSLIISIRKENGMDYQALVNRGIQSLIRFLKVLAAMLLGKLIAMYITADPQTQDYLMVAIGTSIAALFKFVEGDKYRPQDAVSFIDSLRDLVHIIIFATTGKLPIALSVSLRAVDAGLDLVAEEMKKDMVADEEALAAKTP